MNDERSPIPSTTAPTGIADTPVVAADTPEAATAAAHLG